MREEGPDEPDWLVILIGEGTTLRSSPPQEQSKTTTASKEPQPKQVEKVSNADNEKTVEPSLVADDPKGSDEVKQQAVESKAVDKVEEKVEEKAEDKAEDNTEEKVEEKVEETADEKPVDVEEKVKEATPPKAIAEEV